MSARPVQRGRGVGAGGSGVTSAAARRHRLATPRGARVRADERDGRPLVVDGREVDAVRESWLVEDRWWSERPLRRRYWEVVTTCGRNVVVFHDLREGGWFRQR
jgi:CO dehydrogenase/acetyl-CoA synthase delta subunit